MPKRILGIFLLIHLLFVFVISIPGLAIEIPGIPISQNRLVGDAECLNLPAEETVPYDKGINRKYGSDGNNVNTAIPTDRDCFFSERMLELLKNTASGIFALAGAGLMLLAQQKTRQSEEKRWVLQHNLKLKNDSLYTLYLRSTDCYLTLTTYGEAPPEDMNEYEKNIAQPIRDFEKAKIISKVFLENSIDENVSLFLKQVDVCRNAFLQNMHGRLIEYDFGDYEPELTKCYDGLILSFKEELYPTDLKFFGTTNLRRG